jgi:Transposase IS4
LAIGNQFKNRCKWTFTHHFSLKVMSSSNEDHRARLVSQHPHDSPQDIQREPIDCSQLLGGARNKRSAASEVDSEIPTKRTLRPRIAPVLVAAAVPKNLLSRRPKKKTGDASVAIESVIVPAAPVPPDPPEQVPTVPGEKQKQTRNRRKFAKQRLLANCKLFLNPSLATDFSDEEVHVTGQIDQVARPNNGNQFVIKWSRMSKTASFPVAVDRMRTIIDKTVETECLIVEAIERFQNQVTGQGVATAAAALDTGVHRTNLLRLSNVPPLQTPRRADATPRVSTATAAQEAAASMRTSSTTISSHYHERRGRLTRSTYDPADDSNSDCDDADLDEEDDGNWSLADSEEELDEESEDEGNDATEHGSLTDLLGSLVWKYEDLPAEGGFVDEAAPCVYDGKVGNKRVNHLYSDPFECLQLAGLSYEFVARLAANSNDYARKKLLFPNFQTITTEEMYRFLGIMLQISISPKDSGGYEAYFRKTNKVIYGTVIQDSVGFARKYMELVRFKQIRSCFHPEDKVASAGMTDKCYQLRHAINTFNSASSNLRYVPSNVSFDEGGVMCKSRFCPVRQYNKDKPDKFRVDFFIMACPKTFYIHHLDVYQGKNASNVGIVEEARCLPTTQKAVLNDVLSTRIANDPAGARTLAMDNRYNCPELGTLLRSKYSIYCVGTTRSNRRGWPKLEMQLKKDSKEANRGTFKMLIDKTNNVLCVQWVDSKVVNCVSTVLTDAIGSVKRQRGKHKVDFTCPVAVIFYQLWMFGVDKGDQMRSHGGGFSRKAHFKKWYKRVYLGILDCMLANALVVWNDCAVNDAIRRRPTMKRWEFYQYCAQVMMNMKDRDAAIDPHLLCSPGKAAHVMTAPRNKDKCVVCKLESGQGLAGKGKMEGFYKHVVKCTTCLMSCHNVVPKAPRLIHSMPEFKGMTCWQIMHSPIGHDLWKRQHESAKRRYEVQTSTVLYSRLRELYQKPKTITKKKSRGRDAGELKLNFTSSEEEEDEADNANATAV